jgi:hypothetical protein
MKATAAYRNPFRTIRVPSDKLSNAENGTRILNNKVAINGDNHMKAMEIISGTIMPIKKAIIR